MQKLLSFIVSRIYDITKEVKGERAITRAIETPFLLAPMAELGHGALRELIEGFGGCDEYFSEM